MNEIITSRAVCIHIQRQSENSELCHEWAGAKIMRTSSTLLNENNYRKIFNIRRIEFPNLNISRLVFQLSLPNPIKARC